MQGIDFLKSNMKYSSRILTMLFELLKCIHFFSKYISIGKMKGRCIVIIFEFDDLHQKNKGEKWAIFFSSKLKYKM